jgi:Vitamin K-dependent gamma-carboxylase
MFREISDWLEEPLPVLRLEIVRIVAPLAVLGFMSGRLAHADEWIGDAGFRVPDLGGDWRQPIFVPSLPSTVAWAVAATMVLTGLACSFGYRTRTSAMLFAATLVFVAVSDRLAAFTVSKLSPAVMLAVATGPAGTRLGVDAWRKCQRGGDPPEKTRPMGSVRFLQLLLITIYSASGIAKARGDWLSVPLVLWSHLHDSYQTGLSFALASVLPGWSWTLMQGLVLAFETLAPLWFAMPRTRTYAFVFGLGMHAMIGLCFGPVVWFALLMMTLLVAGYAPASVLAPLERLADRMEPSRPRRPSNGSVV